MLIDYDDPSTFPVCLGEWDSDFEQMIRRNVNIDEVEEGWEIKQQLQNLHIDEMPIIQNFLRKNPDTEVAVCHCTRILDETTYWNQGIVTNGGRSSEEEKRIRDLLEMIGLQPMKIDEVIGHAYYYWDRDKKQRTESVHFFIEKKLIYEDDQVNNFAISLGGEILRWSIEAMGHNLYRQEPYKRLWIMGTPSVIKFKCRLEDVHELYRSSMIAEIVKYFIVVKMFGYPYKFKLTGMTYGKIPPENIISIEEIKDYISMQEKYPDFQNFYDELK
jgi:hypothetical protein